MSPDAGPTARGGFFSSRWVDPPAHVTELGGTGLAAGFRAAGVAAGVKPGGVPDVGLLVSDRPGTVSAARFTRSGVRAAPVVVCTEACDLEAVRAVVVNSGNANAATGPQGMDHALAMQAAAATATEAATGVPVDPRLAAVASTGVIGVPLPIDNIKAGIATAADALAAAGDAAFAAAIQTTDAFEKRARVSISLSGGPVTLTAQAKGAGMISPRFATLLCFVQTDAALAPDTCHLLLSVCVKRSFERISVDGQLSTNDTVILQCNGASGVRVAPQTQDELRFGEALDAVLRQLALMVARDGEGARRVGRVIVRGGDESAVAAVARAVADSPLVKTALYGADPNWGRIVQAVGAAMPGAAPLQLEITIEGVRVCSHVGYVSHDEAALARAVERDEVEYEIGLPGTGAEAEMFFSDLGHEYVKINAEYTT